MTPIKYLLWLAKTNFHRLWQILVYKNDEPKAQDRLTWRFFSAERQLKMIKLNLALDRLTFSFFTAVWQLKINIWKTEPRDSMITYVRGGFNM